MATVVDVPARERGVFPGSGPIRPMYKLGLVDTIQLAVSLVFALPLGLFGANMAMDGRPVGWALLVVAVLMVVLPYYLWSPPGLGDIASGAAGLVTGGRKGGED